MVKVEILTRSLVGLASSLPFGRKLAQGFMPFSYLSHSSFLSSSLWDMSQHV